jgi:hypothetical protein
MRKPPSEKLLATDCKHGHPASERSPKTGQCRACIRERVREHNTTQKGKAVKATYNARPETKAMQAAWRASARGKAIQKAYNATPKAKAARAAYRKKMRFLLDHK